MRLSGLCFAFVGWLLLLVAGPASAADWRHEVPVLRIGFVAGDNVRRAREVIEPFRRHLSLELAIPVEVVPARDVAMLIDAQTSARIDYAIYGASAFAAANAACRCLDPLVVPKALDGATGYHSILVTATRSGLRTLADLKGRTVVTPGRRSTSGYLVPLMELGRDGIALDDYFAQTEVADGPDAALRTVLLGTADAAFVWSSLKGDRAKGYSRGTLSRLVADGTMTMDEVAIIWQSHLIPHGPHALRRGLPPELKTLLVKILTRLKDADLQAYDAVERRFGGGFVAADPAAFKALTDAFTVESRSAPVVRPGG